MIYKNKIIIVKIVMILICIITINFFTKKNEYKANNNKILILCEESKEYEQEKNELNDFDILNKIDKNNLHLKGTTYFYLNNVTPFNDLSNLIDEINYLKQNGIKFFIEASPVFVNTNLKAMGRFAECLRYAQSNGGRVIMSFPIMNSKKANGDSINSDLIYNSVKLAFDNYTNYWVYPVGISVDESLIYKKELKNILECTNTLFLNSKYDSNYDIDDSTIKSYDNVIQKIDLDNYTKNSKNNLYAKRAIYIESNYDFEEFKKNVDKIIKKEISFTSNSDLSSYMKFDNEVKSNVNGVFFNNKNVTPQRFISEDEYKSAFDTNNNNREENQDKADLTASNKVLEILSLVSLIIFLVMLILSKNIERKRFFK
ncbi:hypothetical protein [Clostridium saccharobutylicum]|uniref:DUF2334 domain-containing protein n=1 Tax=Clostridium saccharobutylicum TaxID=169679 RepID=A0A1S8N1V8_CLOSA|nr:hypothetical protein [Clostridium saccharobutylicum]OOM10358.1 hypothetical protein CLOSAC_29790 [Clostridium saccharobutylicum]